MILVGIISYYLFRPTKPDDKPTTGITPTIIIKNRTFVNKYKRIHRRRRQLRRYNIEEFGANVCMHVTYVVYVYMKHIIIII